jgi:hypothetical protein
LPASAPCGRSCRRRPNTPPSTYSSCDRCCSVVRFAPAEEALLFERALLHLLLLSLLNTVSMIATHRGLTFWF